MVSWWRMSVLPIAAFTLIPQPLLPHLRAGELIFKVPFPNLAEGFRVRAKSDLLSFLDARSSWSRILTGEERTAHWRILVQVLNVTSVSTHLYRDHSNLYPNHTNLYAGYTTLYAGYTTLLLRHTNLYASYSTLYASYSTLLLKHTNLYLSYSNLYTSHSNLYFEPSNIRHKT